MRRWRSVVVLSGGVGGARLVDGLAAVLPAEALTVIVNTGDDFTHWGLTICPDLDTIMYTLAGLSHPTQGWGLVDETFHAFAMVERQGGPAWFRLGDRDLGTHLVRTEALSAGQTLTDVTASLCQRLGVGPRLLTMADAPRPTLIDTAEGTLGFQDWLVRRRAQVAVTAVRSTGAARPTTAVLDAIEDAEVVVVGPSNPYVSIDPILGLDGVAAAIARKPVIAVSPIVGGRAVKGPLAGMIETLAHRAPSAAAVADHYGALLTGFVVERGDQDGIAIPTRATDTIMDDRDARARVAGEVLAFADELLASGHARTQEQDAR